MTHNVFIDLETGGLDPKANGITEIVAVGFIIGTDENGLPFINETEAYRTLVKPEQWQTYSLGALSLQQGYRSLDQLILAGTEPVEAYHQLKEFIHNQLGESNGGQNWIGRLWAHEAWFDWGFLRALEERLATTSSFRGVFGKRCDWSCSKFLYRRLAAIGVVPEMQEVHLKSIAKHYGIDFPVEHTALGDTRAALKCLEAILRDEYHYYMKRPVDILDLMITNLREQRDEKLISETVYYEKVAAIDVLQSYRKNITGELLQ